jgi:hypothetical protein
MKTVNTIKDAYAEAQNWTGESNLEFEISSPKGKVTFDRTVRDFDQGEFFVTVDLRNTKLSGGAANLEDFRQLVFPATASAALEVHNLLLSIRTDLSLSLNLV